MRPIYLKMSAFGSYANETEIDFTNVEQGVFLITGDTGSGKTTIFDAITFALYGQTSGGKREGTMMRSQYADLSTRTFVELLFECRGERYRVIRNPEYERESKRKKKDGQRAVTKEKASVELYLPDGSLYPGNRQEINGKLVEILGVDARQFTQISMIAQGEFLKLLHARSDERKEIFSRIFDTRIFRSVQEELKNRTKQLYGQLEDNRKACLREIQQLEAEEECLPGIRQLLDQLLDSSAKEPDLDLEEIIGVQILEADRTEYELLQEQDKNVRKELDTQNRVYSISREYAERFRELDRIRDEIKKLEAQKQQWEVQEEKIGWGQKSLAVFPFETACKKAAANREETEKRLEYLTQWFESHGQDVQEKLLQMEEWKKFQKRLEEQEVPVLHRLEQSLEQYRGLKTRLKEMASLEKKWKTGQEAYREVNEAYQKLAQEYEQTYQMYFREQAGIMAADLSEGQPCPVCGSLHHPQKAVLSEQAPTRQQVEELKKRREEAEQNRDQKQKELMELSGKMEKELAVVREMERQLLGQEQEDSSPEQIRIRWETWEKQALQRLKKGKKQVADTQAGLEKSTAAYQKAVQEESIRKGQRDENEKLLEQQKKQEAQEYKKYLKEIRTQGFADEVHYQSCRMEQKEIERLHSQLEKYRKKCMEAEQKRKLLEQQLDGKEPPDMKALEEKLQELTQQLKNVQNRMRKVYSRREKNKDAHRKLQLLKTERTELRNRYEKVGNISRTANGNLTGSVKMDFESYMQRQYFEQMIQCANHHLQKMASGQFLLRCRSLDKLSTQASAGLDLDVYSLVTGKVRDVKTLSGGESFMAALALALGMTDVITRTTGAVRMDTLFIDEGFGSLDENSREQAIRILQGLACTSRMVGIISHVTELKDQIQQQLMVTKGKQGSQAVWR